MQNNLKMKILSDFLLTILSIIVLLFTATIVFVKCYWERRYLYQLSSQLPGPVGLPIVGNGLEFFCKKEDFLKVILQMTEPYASPSKLWLGPRLIIFIKDPDQLQNILLSPHMSTKSYIYGFLEPFLGKGLFTSAGNAHRTHRKLLQPLFSQKVLDGYSHMFQNHAKRLVNKIRKHANQTEFDISIYLHESAFECAMDIFLEDKNDHSIDYKDIPQYIRRFYNMFFTRVTTFWLHPDFIYNKTLYFKEQSKMTQMAKIMTQELMNTRVPEIIRRIEKGSETAVVGELRTPSTLEMIIEMLFADSTLFTKQECVDHMMTFIATSQDTQSTAIAFTCMMLGAYPEIQDRVFKEIKEVVGDRQEFDLTDVLQFKYLEMCIKESMRLFPVAPFIFRDTTKKFQLGKHLFPKGVTVALGIYNVHRDPLHWEKPEEYYPEHFTSEAVKKRHPYAYIPFSAGPRRCIAQQFSYVNMKIIISTLLLNYKLKGDMDSKNIEIMTDVSIRPVGGYLIKVEKRNTT